jgi:hypothetical protein
MPPVNVTQSDNVLAFHTLQNGCSPPADTDAGYIEFFAWRDMTGASENKTRHNRERRRRRGPAYKITTGQSGFFDGTSLEQFGRFFLTPHGRNIPPVFGFCYMRKGESVD